MARLADAAAHGVLLEAVVRRARRGHGARRAAAAAHGARAARRRHHRRGRHRHRARHQRWTVLDHGATARRGRSAAWC